MDKREKNILFLLYYPENISPGQRFRVELYKDSLTKNNYRFTYHNFLTKKNYKINYDNGMILKKIMAVINGFAKRFFLLFTLNKFDYIFIYREAAPIGPPVLEWLISKLFRKKIIYDFDDAIWLPYLITESGFLTRAMKSKSKVKFICNWAYKVSCGNDFLCNYAKNYNSNVIFNPTCVDTGNRYNIITNHQIQKVTIGWTGSFSTLNYLEAIEPVLKKLTEKYDFFLKVICNRPPHLELNNLVYVPWTKENEIQELASCQIGLMPLKDEVWSEGKCGFKLIQYMALEIAPVASPFGVNKLIIEQGIDGLLCNNDEEWYLAIEKLILDAELRKKIGQNGRKKIIQSYSLKSNEDNFLRLFS